MRKAKTSLRFVLIAFFVVILFSGSVQTGGPASSSARDKCTTVIVGKDATGDGSVLLGHNEDWGEYLMPLRWSPREKHQPGETFKLRDGQVIPQVEETYAFIWPAAECSGINELQVAMADDTGSCRKELFQNERGIDLQEFVQLALQRSRTAKEAVLTMGGLIEKYGYRSHNGLDGDMVSIADPNEGWWMEVTIGGIWVAQKVPDDAFVVLANRFRIGEVNLKDSAQFLACPNLVDYAQQRGWYDPAQGPFHFYRAYGTAEDARSAYNTRREWRGNWLLSGSKFREEENPLTVVPGKKLIPRDIMALLRDHYEGTEYDLTKGYEKGSPHHTSERTICRMTTDATTVAHLRGWLPPEIGGLLWLSVGTPCSSVYVPYYLGVLDFPKPYAFLSDTYNRENAFWVFNSLENLVDRYYAEKRKLDKGETRAIDYVAGFWKDFEDGEFAMQAAVEKTALELYRKDKSLARSFLDTHSSALGLRAFADAQMLADTLRTKYYR
jgi:dipeptidase